MISVCPLLPVRAASRSDMGQGSTMAALTAEQIDNLMAPVALYPDPLLAQLLPASTFVDQIDKAARFLRGNNNSTKGVDDQAWDVSVKSIAHYPSVVYQMSDKLDWTTAMGQAYVSQATDVFNSIQRLRHRAQKAGYLKSNPQQNVVEEKDIIKIVPAQASVIFVPTYNPQVVYVAPASTGPSAGAVAATAALSFGAGLAIGAWLNNDCNWHTHTVYYHGWHGGGWVSHSATVVRVNNSVYVSHRYSTVHVNTAVVNRNVNYNNINHYSSVNRNVNYNNVNVNNVNRNNVNVNNANVNNVNRNNVNSNSVNNKNLNKNLPTSNAANNAYRGKGSTGAAQPAQNGGGQFSGFGGGGNSAQTRAESARGQSSRASAQTSSRERPTGEKSSSRGGGGRRRN